MPIRQRPFPRTIQEYVTGAKRRKCDGVSGVGVWWGRC